MIEVYRVGQYAGILNETSDVLISYRNFVNVYFRILSHILQLLLQYFVYTCDALSRIPALKIIPPNSDG